MTYQPNFNTNASYLASKLFYPDRPRIGAVTNLNINVLPDFVQFLKQKFNNEEIIGLSEYHLQNYIMELSIKDRINENFQSFVDKILCHIRESKQFWIHGKFLSTKEDQKKQIQEKKHQSQAIAQFPIDLAIIKSKIPQYQQKSFKNLKIRRIQQFIEISEEYQLINKNKENSKTIFNNYSMMPAYVIKKFNEENNKKQNYKKGDNKSQKMLHSLQQILQFILISQKQKIIKKQYTKTRSLERTRKVPSYLQNKQLFFRISEIKRNQQNKQKESESENGQNLSQQQDSPNQFYYKFQKQIQKKQYYESKMFNKTKQINQSHNLLQILNCSIYLLHQIQESWFENNWKKLEQQRILRQTKRRQQEEQNDQIDQQEEGENQNYKNQDNLNKLNYNKQKEQNLKQQKQKQDQKQSLNNDIKLKEKSKSISSLDQVIQIGIKKPIFCQNWKNPNFKFDKLLSNIDTRIFTMKEIYFLSKTVLNQKLKTYSKFRKIQMEIQNNSKNMENALYSFQIDLDQILHQYKQMIEHPQNVKLSAFKTQGITIPWDQSDYLMFLKGLQQYFFVPTNNKKIGVYMSKGVKNIQANHVKYVKNLYLKNMQNRIDRGQSGGGKKGRMLGKIQFLEKDIQFFSMKWFQKLKKSKKKKNRRRNNSQDGGEDIDSAY